MDLLSKMLSFLLVAVFFIVIVTAFTLPHEGLYRLDIVHYNDFHARFEETSVSMATCRNNNDSCLGGFPRLSYEIELLLKEKPNAILLNAGDSFQGTYWYTLLKWNVIQEFMNLLPHDAHAIGNHEFDDGPEGLAPYLAALKAPVVAANMDTSKEPVLQDLYKPYIIVERKGRKIGIIGLITTDTEKLSFAGNVIFNDPKEAARTQAAELTEKGVDIIVLLSHCGLDVDKEIAQGYAENIDIIVGGHTHSLLWNGESPSHETVAGPYPIEYGDSKHKVLIVQASAFTKYMGNFSVFFDYKGEFVKWEGGPIFLNRSIPEDKEIKARMEPYLKRVQEAENQPIGSVALGALNFEDCVFGECALGDVMVDSFNKKAMDSVETKYDYIALVQRGDIKSTISEGNISRGEIFGLLPYNDRLQSFELQGVYLRQALERSVSEAWAYDPFKGPWVLQVTNMKLTYNVSLPEGQRLISAFVGSEDNLKPLNDTSTYQITVPSYLGDGGDGFTMLKEYRNNLQIIGRDQAVLEEYLVEKTPIEAKTYGRITILS